MKLYTPWGDMTLEEKNAFLQPRPTPLRRAGGGSFPYMDHGTPPAAPAAGGFQAAPAFGTGGAGAGWGRPDDRTGAVPPPPPVPQREREGDVPDLNKGETGVPGGTSLDLDVF